MHSPPSDLSGFEPLRARERSPGRRPVLPQSRERRSRPADLARGRPFEAVVRPFRCTRRNRSNCSAGRPGVVELQREPFRSPRAVWGSFRPVQVIHIGMSFTVTNTSPKWSSIRRCVGTTNQPIEAEELTIRLSPWTGQTFNRIGHVSTPTGGRRHSRG